MTAVFDLILERRDDELGEHGYPYEVWLPQHFAHFPGLNPRKRPTADQPASKTLLDRHARL